MGRRDITTALVALVFATAATSTSEPISPQEAVAQLEECGLAGFTAQYEDELQDHVLVPPAGLKATDDQLICADDVYNRSYYWIEFPEELRSRFVQVNESRRRQRGLEAATEWLASKGMLETAPKFDPSYDSKDAFARRVEEACGPKADEALVSTEFGIHTVSQQWLKAQIASDEMGPELMCMAYVSEYAGFPFGFIGNERVSVPD